MSKSPRRSPLADIQYIKDHARDRWRRRSVHSDWDGTLERAIRESMYVGCDAADGRVLLHPPSQMLIVVRDWIVRTVITTDGGGKFNGQEIRDDHLDVCGVCGLRYDPRWFDDCYWCDDHAEAKNAGGIRVRTATLAGPSPEPPKRYHDCPECGDATIGFGGSDHCKECHLAQEREQGRTQVQRCRECDSPALEGTEYCLVHRSREINTGQGFASWGKAVSRREDRR